MCIHVGMYTPLDPLDAGVIQEFRDENRVCLQLPNILESNET
jgi:hypothetical protein